MLTESWVLWVKIFRTSSPGGSISSNPEKTALRRQGGELIRLLLIKKTRYVNLSNLMLLCVWEDASVWSHWNHSFVIYLSYLGLVSCVSITWVSSGLTAGSGCNLIAARWQVFFSSWCTHSCGWWLWLQLLMTVTSFAYWYGRKYSIYQVPKTRERRWNTENVMSGYKICLLPFQYQQPLFGVNFIHCWFYRGKPPT